MNDFFINLTQFTKTRIILSLWYSCILLIILMAFSTALSITYNNDVTRIVLRRDFGSLVPTRLTNSERRLILEQVKELRNTSRLDLIIIDLTTLIIGAGLSYFLAGKTLNPIKKTMENQKEFVAVASHELKSPITTIQTTCEVVLRSNGKSNKDYKKTLEQVYDQCIRLGRLVNDLLTLSILDTGSKKAFQDFSLSEIVEKELELMKPVFKKSGILLEKHLSDYRIFGDKDKIQQLIVILLDNAVKFTQNGGKVSVTIKATNDHQAQVIVQDTGIGIPYEKQQAVFRRFYQADESHAGLGAGLGLAIAQSIMKLHKGNIKIKSSPNMGSTFTCTFPKNNYR